MGRKAYVHPNLPHHMRLMRKRSGKVYYYYDAGGKPRNLIPLGCDYVEALRLWAIYEADRAPGAVVTFKDVSDRYLIDILPGKAIRTQKDNLKELANLLTYFGPAPFEEIEPRHVRAFLKWRSTKRIIMVFDKRLGREVEKVFGAEVRANREKALLSHIWNFARDSGITKLANPCTGIKGYEEPGRDVYIEDTVFSALWDIASQPMQDAMDLAYLTGQRPADVLKLSEVDIKDNTLAVSQNKRGGRVKLRLSLLAPDGVTLNGLGLVIQRILANKRNSKVHTLQLICNEKGGPLTYSALDNRFEKLRARAAELARALGDEELAKAVLEFQFKDLRAKAGTDKADSASLDEAKRQLGHTNLKMTEKYVRARKGETVSPTK